MNVETEVSPALSVQPVVKTEHIGVRLAGRDVLADVSFSLEPGRFLGIIGSNGAGKTTLLRAILGLVPISHGTLRVFGHPPRRGNAEIGYVPQHQTLDPDLPLRARDFVRLGLDGGHWGIGFPNAVQHERVNDALKAVAASDYGDAPVGRLSGGQQQRLLLAQALVGNPCLLLLDEPLANLDLKSRWEVVTLVKSLSEDRDIAVAFVAHDINPLLDAMDSVLYLANGRAVCGTVGEVVRSEVLTHLYGFPVEVIHAGGHVLVAGAGESDECHA